MATWSTSNELKNLTTQIKEIDTELTTLVERQSECSRRINDLRNRRIGLQKRIDDIKTGDDIVVSEHAYLRYIERVLGMNLGDLANEIVPDTAKQLIKTFKSGRVDCTSHTLIVEKGVVVSIVTKDGSKKGNHHAGHSRQGSRRAENQRTAELES